jgi:hypothetical protein
MARDEDRKAPMLRRICVGFMMGWMLCIKCLSSVEV